MLVASAILFPTTGCRCSEIESRRREQVVVREEQCVPLSSAEGGVLPCLGLSQHGKTLDQVLSGRGDANVRFDNLRALLLELGFEERTRGSHHVFGKSGIEEQINLQRDGSKAKPYQVKQVRAIILRYDLQES
jgi:predicted RNA binding protein YcfA (HicA-like mRNA interferase family)